MNAKLHSIGCWDIRNTYMTVIKADLVKWAQTATNAQKAKAMVWAKQGKMIIAKGA